MTPWQRAKQWWDEHATQDFWEAVGEHLSAGLVHATPHVFLLAAETRWNAEERQFEAGEPNCWFVRLAAAVGHPNACGEFMRVFPHSHDYVAWFRRGQNEPRIYEWDKLAKATGR